MSFSRTRSAHQSLSDFSTLGIVDDHLTLDTLAAYVHTFGTPEAHEQPNLVKPQEDQDLGPAEHESQARADSGARELPKTAPTDPSSSFVEIENPSQWGDFAGGYPSITSPTGSITSARSKNSGKSRVLSLRRMRSNRNPSRIEPGMEGRPLDSFMTPSLHSNPDPDPHPLPNSPPSILPADPKQRDHVEADEDPTIDAEPPKSQPSLAEPLAQSMAGRTFSTTSKGTIPLSLFRDFDGVHFSSLAGEILSEDEAEKIEQELGPRPASVDEISRPKEPWAEPPPQEGMLYYPAPVPTNLNLPQRLSKQPPAAAQAKRKSAVLGSMPIEARKSAVWLNQESEQPSEQNAHAGDESAFDHAKHNSRHSNMNLKHLPPQLRASVFFDHHAIPQEVELKHGSAVMTLDSLLDASTHAPVGQFGGSALAQHTRGRKSTTSLLDDGRSDAGRSRASLLSRPGSSIDLLGPSDGRRSQASLLSRPGSSLLNELGPSRRNRQSDMSISTDLRLVNDAGTDHGEHEDRSDNHSDHETTPLQASNDHEEPRFGPLKGGEDEDEDEQDEESGAEPVYGQPTNLIAELQLRKHQLRQRNRTAANAFPNGMHSTLLELDAVAQIEKKRRRGKHTTLAWEDLDLQHDENAEEDDDDVPLGVLFPKNGETRNHVRSDWDRPLGLIQRRDREDNEPLSRRQNRLRGDHPGRPQQIPQFHPEQGYDQQPEDQNSEHEGETLAQRTRRLRSSKALDDAINPAAGDLSRPANRTLSSDFASEFMSQFGGLDENHPDKIENAKPNADSATGPPAEHPEETLGQRRRRLQAESQARQASNGSTNPASQPNITSRQSSLANILSANPVPASNPQSRNVSGESSGAPGLLGQSEQHLSSRRQQLADQNQWQASGIPEPLVSLPPQEKEINFRGQSAPGFAANAKSGYAGGMFNDGTGGAGMGVRSRASMMSLGMMPQGRAAAASPIAGPGTGGWGNMHGVRQFQHGFGAAQSPSPYGGGAVAGTGASVGAGGGGYFAGVHTGPAGAGQLQYQQQGRKGTPPPPQMPPMSPLERAKIENWRMSVVQ